ncbi:MAG: MerR family transcriptional regulator [Bacteroidales bacterium]|nr:MerR family transcriptional regulator [Bacteroidales bacterium]
MAEKLYYSIGEVAEMFQVNASLIRFWEKEFPIIHPQKNRKGNRMFTTGDIDHLRIIYNLLKERGFTIQGARDYLSKNRSEAEKNHEVVKSLQNIRSLLVRLNDEL